MSDYLDYDEWIIVDGNGMEWIVTKRLDAGSE
jgi:hypothetical protein